MTQQYKDFNWMMKCVLLDDAIDSNSKVELHFFDADGCLAETSKNYIGGVITWAFIQRLLAIAEEAVILREAQKAYFKNRTPQALNEATRKEREFDKLIYGFVCSDNVQKGGFL